MQVRDIFRIKGTALFTVAPGTPLMEAARTMALHDVGSLVVMDGGRLAGMLTFREALEALSSDSGGQRDAGELMQRDPVHCSPETGLDELRRLLLDSGARYIPVMDGTTLLGVISFRDVARAVVQEQDFENRMLKAYIRDWPPDSSETSSAGAS